MEPMEDGGQKWNIGDVVAIQSMTADRKVVAIGKVAAVAGGQPWPEGANATNLHDGVVAVSEIQILADRHEEAATVKMAQQIKNAGLYTSYSLLELASTKAHNKLLLDVGAVVSSKLLIPFTYEVGGAPTSNGDGAST